MTRLQARKHALLAGCEIEVAAEVAVANPNWLDTFAETGPLTIEIGLGKDTHLIDQAQAAPDSRFVGFEYSKKKIEKVFNKALLRGVQNLRGIRADATRAIGPLFADNSVSHAFILFPDPWPKKRHHKKRIVQSDFIHVLAQKLQPGAQLELRTDDPPYAEQMQEVLEAEPLLENMVAEAGFLSAPRHPAQHIPTIFERKFRGNDLPIHYFYYQKPE
ncbi:MAG: tRNA (guanosine(46)-N7)-methyltransferase TrmB [Planctomycetota bacterium]